MVYLLQHDGQVVSQQQIHSHSDLHKHCQLPMKFKNFITNFNYYNIMEININKFITMILGSFITFNGISYLYFTKNFFLTNFDGMMVNDQN